MQEQHPENGFDEIVGESPELKQTLRLVIKVAQTDTPVLILGEAGSGKELIARAIHRMSARRNASFLKVNCEATASRTLESDLFGQERGTEGESRKIGHLELPNPGILFLDEIADVPMSLQAKLLRLLEGREFERVGGTHGIRTNVRLIATTKYDLGERVAEQMFLGDLYDKLNVFPIQVPPLRERRDDIPLLAHYFRQKFARRMNKPVESISAETTSWLTNSDWPGNVRELENLIERSVALTDGVALQVSPARLRS